MVRRFANQVHHQVSRLMRANYIKKEPAWYQAVLQYPPLPLPPKASTSRTQYDHTPMEPNIGTGQPVKLRKVKTRPLPIRYIEDDVRRQFFRDHPFEAFRPRTLVEGASIEPPHTIQKEYWTRLRQRGRNPSPEDAIRFAVNLHLYYENQQDSELRGMPISEAYLRAVAQFRALRSEHHIASTFAAIEAEALGISFEETEVEKLFTKHKKELEKWGEAEQLDDESANAAKKRWRGIVEKNVEQSEWTKGEQYVKLWKDNATADYAPRLTQPIPQHLAADTVENQVTTS